jgi:predicted nucleotidyltransferase
MTRLSEEQMLYICEFLSQRLNAETVILFGSAAKDRLRNDSDIDLAFISELKVDPYDIFMTAQQLADKLHREVDLIDFHQASTVFQSQIVGSGIVLQDKKPLMRQYAFMRSLKAYAMLNEERDSLIKSYKVPGGGESDLGHHPEQIRNYSALHPESL